MNQLRPRSGIVENYTETTDDGNWDEFPNITGQTSVAKVKSAAEQNSEGAPDPENEHRKSTRVRRTRYSDYLTHKLGGGEEVSYIERAAHGKCERTLNPTRQALGKKDYVTLAWPRYIKYTFPFKTSISEKIYASYFHEVSLS